MPENKSDLERECDNFDFVNNNINALAEKYGPDTYFVVRDGQDTGESNQDSSVLHDQYPDGDVLIISTSDYLGVIQMGEEVPTEG